MTAQLTRFHPAIASADPLTVSKYRTAHGQIQYAYENEHGAMVATRTLYGASWCVRLYLSPDDWTTLYGIPSVRAAERMCVEHAELMS